MYLPLLFEDWFDFLDIFSTCLFQIVVSCFTLMSYLLLSLPLPHIQETADERWRPILGVESIIISVISMLSDPNDESPANIDAAVMWRNDRPAFKKRVRDVVRKSQEEC